MAGLRANHIGGGQVGHPVLVTFTFHRVPVFGILATILAPVVLPVVLAASMVTAGFGLINPLIGEFLGWLVWHALAYLLALVSASPGTTLEADWVSAPVVWLWYIGIVGVLVLPQRWAYRGKQMATLMRCARF